MEENNKHIEKEINEISPQLLKSLRKDDLDVPANYFEQLEKDILAKTIYTNKKSNVVQMRKWYFYAASVAAVFALMFFGLQIFTSKQPVMISFEEQIAAMSSDEIKTMIEKNLDEFDAQLLIETNFINASVVTESMHADLQSQTDNKKELINTQQNIELDREILNQIDDSALQELLMDESLFNDLGL